MISRPIARSIRSSRGRLLAALLGLVGLTALSNARAVGFVADPAVVTPADTYSIEILGYNTTTPSGNFYAIANNLTPTFGLTQTYANSTLVAGQVLTVTSSETVNGGTVTDSFRISVPNTFIPAGTVDNNGNVVNALVFSIGNYYIPTGGTANTLDFTLPLTPGSTTLTGTLGYTLNGTPGSLGLTQNPQYSNGNRSLSNAEAGQTPNGGAISQYNPNSFTLTVTYPVPEPSTTAAVILGAGALLWITVQRRRVRA